MSTKGDSLKPVASGSPMMIGADAWNGLTRAAAAARARQHDVGVDPVALFRQTGIVKVRNSTGSGLDRYSVLGLGAPLISASDNLLTFLAEPTFDGTTPSSDSAGAFGILLDPIPAGGIGRAVVAGVTLVRLDVSGSLEDFAEAQVGSTAALLNAATGSARVLWAESSGSQRWAVVRIGDGSGSGLIVDTVDGSPSYTGIHTLRFDEADNVVVTNPATGVARIDLNLSSYLTSITVKAVDDNPIINTFLIAFQEPDGFVLTETGGGARIEFASATTVQKGAVDTSAQEFAGEKTFSDNIIVGEEGGQVQLGLNTFDGWGFIQQSGPLQRLMMYTTSGSGFNTGVEFNDADVFIRLFSEAVGEEQDWELRLTSASTTHTGQTGTQGGMTFYNGVWVSGSFSGSSYTDEQAQDAIGGILVDGQTINFTYADATPSITAEVIYQMAITSDSNGLKLVGDTTTPGASKYYGTDSGASRGWHALPAALTDGDKGNITVSSSGTVWTIDNGVVIDAKLRDSGACTVIGRGANSIGSPADITASANGQLLRRRSDALAFEGIHRGRMSRVAAQSIANATWTKIAFDTENFDDGGIVDVATNDRITVARDGKYLICGQVTLNPTLSATSALAVGVRLNGSGSAFVQSGWYGHGGSLTAMVMDIVSLSAGDYLELFAIHFDGAAVNTGTGAEAAFFAIMEMP